MVIHCMIAPGTTLLVQSRIAYSSLGRDTVTSLFRISCSVDKERVALLLGAYGTCTSFSSPSQYTTLSVPGDSWVNRFTSLSLCVLLVVLVLTAEHLLIWKDPRFTLQMAGLCCFAVVLSLRERIFCAFVRASACVIRQCAPVESNVKSWL